MRVTDISMRLALGANDICLVGESQFFCLGIARVREPVDLSSSRLDPTFPALAPPSVSLLSLPREKRFHKNLKIPDRSKRRR